jgi:hypothetical protein
MTDTISSLLVDSLHNPIADIVKTELLRVMDKKGEREVHLRAVPVRYFTYAESLCLHCNGLGENRHGQCDKCDGRGTSELDIVEVTRERFAADMTEGMPFEYERNTVRENGVSQICLTLSGGY